MVSVRRSTHSSLKAKSVMGQHELWRYRNTASGRGHGASGGPRLASKPALVLAVALMSVVAGCSSDGNASSPSKVDISKVVAVKPSFGPEFKVKETARGPIDPAFFSARKLPLDASFDPPDCEKVVVGPEMPLDVRGTMATVSAEGDGNQFLVIALQTAQPLPFDDPAQHCSKVTFSGPRAQGSVEVADTPKIEGVKTLGMHRVLQMINRPGPAIELYHYSAQFGEYEVIVTAKPVAEPGQPIAPLVDTQRACDLLVKAVAAVRS